MKFRRIDDQYEIAPPCEFGGVVNRELPEEEMFYLTVSGINLTEQDLLEKEQALDMTRYTPERRIDEQQRRLKELVKSKIKSVHNYRIGDHDVTSPAELLDVIGRDLRTWLFTVLLDADALTRAERKNFLPPAASPSMFPEQAANGTAWTAVNENVTSATATTVTN